MMSKDLCIQAFASHDLKAVVSVLCHRYIAEL